MTCSNIAWLMVLSLIIGLMAVLIAIGDKWYHDTKRRGVWKSNKG